MNHCKKRIIYYNGSNNYIHISIFSKFFIHLTWIKKIAQIGITRTEITFYRGKVSVSILNLNFRLNYRGYSYTLYRCMYTLPRMAWNVLSNHRFAPKCLEPPP